MVGFLAENLKALYMKIALERVYTFGNDVEEIAQQLLCERAIVMWGKNKWNIHA